LNYFTPNKSLSNFNISQYITTLKVHYDLNCAESAVKLQLTM